MRWRAWYVDGSSVSSDDFTWQEIPADGVVILKLWSEQKSMYCGLDAIWWDGKGRVFQLDIPEPFHRLAEREAKRGRLKFGKQIPDEDYERIHTEALAARE